MYGGEKSSFKCVSEKVFLQQHLGNKLSIQSIIYKSAVVQLLPLLQEKQHYL